MSDRPRDGLRTPLWSLGYLAIAVSFFVIGMWVMPRTIAETGNVWWNVPYLLASVGTGIVFGKLTFQARREIRTCWGGHAWSEWMRKGYTRADGDFVPVYPALQWRMCDRCGHTDMREGEPSLT